MLQCIFLLSDSGEVMLEKQVTGHHIDRSICDWFWEQAISRGDSFKGSCVLNDYLAWLNEDLIKDNFIIVYELLDEMINNGFPLTTETNILQEMMAPPNIVIQMLSVVTGNSSYVIDTLPGATASCFPGEQLTQSMQIMKFM